MIPLLGLADFPLFGTRDNPKPWMAIKCVWYVKDESIL